MDLNSSHSATLGLFLIFGSLICLGTWPTLLRLCTIFTFDNDKNRTKQTKWKKIFGQGRHPCHVYLDYAMSYVFVGSFLLPWFFYSKSEGVSYTDPNMKPLLWLAAFVGGSLLALGNLTTQWSTTAFGAPLTTVLALQASMCVILGTYWNYRLQPEKTSNPTLLLTGVGMFLVAIACSVAAQTIYQTQQYRSFTSETLKDEETTSIYDVDSGSSFSGVSLTASHMNASPNVEQSCSSVVKEATNIIQVRHGDSFSSYGTLSFIEQDEHTQSPKMTHHLSLISSPNQIELKSSFDQGPPSMRIPSSVQLCINKVPKSEYASKIYESVHSTPKGDSLEQVVKRGILNKAESTLRDEIQESIEVEEKSTHHSYSNDIKRQNIAVGVAVAMFGGFCFGLFSPLFNISVNDPFRWYQNNGLLVTSANSCFATSFAACSILCNICLMWYPPMNSGASKSTLLHYIFDDPLHERTLAMLAGAVCSVGNFLQFQGGSMAGFAAADMVEAFPLVATVWDLVVFGEFRHCSTTVLSTLTGMYFAYVLGISSIAFSVSL